MPYCPGFAGWTQVVTDCLSLACCRTGDIVGRFRRPSPVATVHGGHSGSRFRFLVIAANRAAAPTHLPGRQSSADATPDSCRSSPTTRGRATHSGRRVCAMMAPTAIPHRGGRPPPLLQRPQPPFQLAARGLPARPSVDRVAVRPASVQQRPVFLESARGPPGVQAAGASTASRGTQDGLGKLAAGKEALEASFLLYRFFFWCPPVGPPRVRACATAGQR